MKPLSGERAPAAVSAAILARAVIHAGTETLAELRQSPGPALGTPLPSNFLKHADEQTIASIAAVLRAVHTHGLAQTDFSRWGVLAAPRYLARAIVAHAVKRFQQEGAWGMSPHLIPHRSLHSVSGTISQALNLHGPNFGVGGGPGSAAKALLAAAAMLECDRPPGIWVILSGWNWEPGAELPELPASPPACCSAVAMALVPGSEQREGVCWRISAGPVCESSDADSVLTLESVCDAFESAAGGPRTWRLPCGGSAVLDQVEGVAEKRA